MAERNCIERSPACLEQSHPKYSDVCGHFKKFLVNKQTCYLTDGLTDWLAGYLSD